QKKLNFSFLRIQLKKNNLYFNFQLSFRKLNNYLLNENTYIQDLQMKYFSIYIYLMKQGLVTIYFIEIQVQVFILKGQNIQLIKNKINYFLFLQLKAQITLQEYFRVKCFFLNFLQEQFKGNFFLQRCKKKKFYLKIPQVFIYLIQSYFLHIQQIFRLYLKILCLFQIKLHYFLCFFHRIQCFFHLFQCFFHLFQCFFHRFQCFFHRFQCFIRLKLKFNLKIKKEYQKKNQLQILEVYYYQVQFYFFNLHIKLFKQSILPIFISFNYFKREFHEVHLYIQN
ncbi:hypothetical protein IMG5_045990, partial [Ichthyophthirius multifiliis]